MKWRETRGVDLSVNFTLKSTQLTQSHAKIREVRLQSPIKGGLDRRGLSPACARGLVVMELSDENDGGRRTITSWNFSDFSDFRDLV